MKTARAKGGLSTSVPFEPNSNSSILLAHQERRHSDGPQPWSQFHREERCEACLGRCVPEREKHDRFPSIKGGTQSVWFVATAKRTRTDLGHIKGKPTQFAHGHNLAGKSEPNSVKQLPD